MFDLIHACFRFDDMQRACNMFDLLAKCPLIIFCRIRTLNSIMDSQMFMVYIMLFGGCTLELNALLPLGGSNALLPLAVGTNAMVTSTYPNGLQIYIHNNAYLPFLPG